MTPVKFRERSLGRVHAWSAAFLAAVRADRHSEWRRELGDRPGLDAELRRRENATMALVAVVVKNIDPDWTHSQEAEENARLAVEFLGNQVCPTRLSMARYAVRFHGGPFDGAQVTVDSHEDFDLVAVYNDHGYECVAVSLRAGHRPEPGEFAKWERFLLDEFDFDYDDTVEIEAARTPAGLLMTVHTA